MTVSINDVTDDIEMFQDFSESHVNNAIKRATLQTKNDSVVDIAFDTAVTEYAKHLLYVDYFMNYGGVTSSSMLGVSETVSDKTSNDPYLNQYLTTVQNYGNGGDGSFMLL
ncbi:hypothetical protein [Apilactobacillus apinorum]|uniref:hypothetical protein n=1 Tax=Apilactobacillus apinorum TaxID=1218495 RepID=UPI0006B51685|nr:hypothetical protein [Apilactobacillus apinorum]KOY69007.1 hypothetical protein RZ74_08070 [Apilactobacillus apinorum]CAI2679652.1 Hypothetical protein AAPFHON13_08570 [Apilactobacillus apinorum]